MDPCSDEHKELKRVPTTLTTNELLLSNHFMDIKGFTFCKGVEGR